MELETNTGGAEADSKEYWALPIAGCLRNREVRYANAKPREDAHVVDRYNGIFIVADGVTRSADNGRYPEPSPAALAAEVFSLEAHKAICSRLDSDPLDALRFGAHIGNLAVAGLNAKLFPEGDFDYKTKDPGGACAILALIRGNKLFYLYNGDCVAYQEDLAGNFSRLTPSQTARMHAWSENAPQEEQEQCYTRRFVRNNPHHPGRYGVFTGEAAAMRESLIDSGVIDLGTVSRVVFTSDGLDELMNSERRSDLDLGLPGMLLSAAEALEDSTKSRSDDKTYVLLEIFGPLQP